MTDSVSCPQCGEHLDIPPDYRGRKVRCASCQTVFVANPAGDDIPTVDPRPTRNPDADPRDRDSYPRRRPDRDDGPPPRKSNARVWSLLFAVTLLVGGCMGGCVWLSLVANNPKMHVYADDPAYRVELPGEPEVLTGGGGVHTLRPGGQDWYTVKARPATGEGAAGLGRGAAAVVGGAALADGEGKKRVLAAALKEEAAAFSAGPIVDKQATTHGGYPALDAKDFAGAGQDVNNMLKPCVVLRLVLVGDTVYVLAAQGPQSILAQQWWVRRFFLSFEITPPDQVKKKKVED